MRLAPHDVRRARVRRGPLVAVTAASFTGLLLAAVSPRLAPWFGPAHIALVVLAASAFAGAVAAFVAARRAPLWSGADDVAWIIALGSLSIVAGAASAPLGPQVVLFAVALIALAMREPSGSLVVIACSTIVLMPVVRLLALRSPEALASAACAALVAGAAFVALALQTQRLSRALYQRDAVLTERDRAARAASQGATASVSVSSSSSASARTSSAARGASGAEESARKSNVEATEPGWDALVERLRSSITLIAENAGVESSVRAELSGLAPPSNKIRIHLVRIAQEATTQALRLAEPRSITVTLRRGDGGVVLELQDDGAASEATRNKRSLATLRGRVAALGGTAEVRRADRGWVTRVRLPCEQLN